MEIHPSAAVDSRAELGSGVKVGPFAVINSGAVIGDNTEIMPHAFVDQYTTIGANCKVFPFASVGAEPQDLKFKGEKTTLEIGDNTIIRESATLHRGTVDGGGKTVIGNNCLLMAYVHVAHDCHIGNHVIISNSLAMGGHVTIEDHASVGGMVGIHQFTRIGTYAFIGGISRVAKDVPPYMLGEGAVDFNLHGPNTIGLRRKGFSNETIRALKDAFSIVCRNRRPLQEVLQEALDRFPDVPEVKTLVDFYNSSERGVYR
jgi:UDP-N-acetylglucosamine acyltransferase